MTNTESRMLLQTSLCGDMFLQCVYVLKLIENYSPGYICTLLKGNNKSIINNSFLAILKKGMDWGEKGLRSNFRHGGLLPSICANVLYYLLIRITVSGIRDDLGVCSPLHPSSSAYPHAHGGHLPSAQHSLANTCNVSFLLPMERNGKTKGEVPVMVK